MSSFIITALGDKFDFDNPESSYMDIYQIGLSLSKQCRFNGHTSVFYSVAQHSVLVSYYLPPELALAGLLHDASEAFIGDLVTPLKKRFPEFKELEDKIQRAINLRFNLPLTVDPRIKQTDLRVLATEKRDVMPPNNYHWAILDGIDPFGEKIRAQNNAQAYASFIARYKDIMRNGAKFL